MKTTVKQANVLANLDRIGVRMAGRRSVPVLDGEDCSLQLYALRARGLVALGAEGGWVKIKDASGIVGAPGWPAPDQAHDGVR